MDSGGLTWMWHHGLWACGTGNVSQGQHDTDRVGQGALSDFSKDIFTDYRAFNISYFETGLFGIVGKSLASNACTTAKNVVCFLSKLDCLTEDQLELGRRRLKLALAQEYDNCVAESHSLALQLANNVQFNNVQELLASVDCISIEELSATVKNLM
ncbi:unnamed protein product [Leptidea sinapis]|uniref:Peptidase M16 C-terminal domain-containing protein n=1 Tax=Leptidea sinapis TaxID=189913 RepID=A0A5E4QEN9_9NEOP|nr:unnamed protein product [Leptidea sinapis]